MSKGRNGLRVPLFDEVRGLFVLLMVFYHACYNLAVIFPVSREFTAFFWSRPMNILQFLIAADFIFIAGACSWYSRSNLKRGIEIFLWAMVLTVVTFILLPSQTVRFGVLHLLGSSMILFWLVRPLVERVDAALGMVLSLLLFVFTYRISGGYVGFGTWQLGVPAFLYETKYLFWLGFPGKDFMSSDYFGMLPWVFMFLSGSFFGIFAKEGRLPNWCYRAHFSGLGSIGKRALVIYLLHQPVLYGVMWVLFNVIGF